MTATKIETTLQRTPQAISTIDPATLTRSGVYTLQSLPKLVAGLQIEQNGPGSSIFIRGVGSRSITPTSDPSIAFSVDGVYFARTTGLSTTLFDVTRLEVVKGPQGTLYGRNATGGAVNVITNHPVLGKRGFNAELEIGNYDTVRAQAALNLPIGDNAAVRIAGQSFNHKGYLSDGYDDAATKSVRTSVLYTPHDGISLYVSGDYAHQGGQGAGAVPVGPGSNNNVLTTRFVVPSNPYTGPSDPAINAFLAAAAPASRLPIPGPAIVCIGIPFPPGAPVANIIGAPALLTCNNPIGVPPIDAGGYQDNDLYGANLTADVDAGIGNLTVIGGYRGTKINTRFQLDPGIQVLKSNIDQFSGEVRLASKPNRGPLRWLVGAFYLHELQNANALVPRENAAVSNPVASPGSPLPATTCFAPGPAPGICLARATIIQSDNRIAYPEVLNETAAGFGQATLSLTDWLRLTAGVRYTHETKSENNGLVINDFLLPAGVSTSYPSNGSITHDDVSYRAGIEADVAPRSLAYATYATAFHAGGFNFGVRQGPNTFEYQPEKVRSYVIGVKNRLFKVLQLNIERFWLDYENYQQNAFGRVNDGSPACSQLNVIAACPFTLRTENAATARVRGVETDILLALTHNTDVERQFPVQRCKVHDFSRAQRVRGRAYGVRWTAHSGVEPADHHRWHQSGHPAGQRCSGDRRCPFAI